MDRPKGIVISGKQLDIVMAHLGKEQVETAQASESGCMLRLRLIATTDLHAHLFPFNYYSDRRDDGVGLARAAALIGALRTQTPNCLLLDNGDTLQGAPLGDAALAEMLPAGRPHPMVAAMNGLGYDAATVGNHDFDYGLPFLTRSLAGADYPVVLANAVRADGSAFLPGHTILERAFTDTTGAAHRLRVGIVGVAPPQIGQWNRIALKGEIVMQDMVEAVRRELAALVEAKPHVVIVLAHSGIGPADPGPMAENAALAISRLAGVDAVVAGHSHGTHVSAEEGRAPIVQPGYWGSHVGAIDLNLISGPASDVLSERQWNRVDAQVSLHPISSSAAAARRALRDSLRKVPALRTQLVDDHRATRRFVARPIGQSDRTLETYFSLLGPCRAMQFLADAKRAAVQPLLDTRSDLADLPVIAAAAPFKAGGRGGPENYTDIPAGQLRLRHAADIYVYPNAMAVVRANGTQIRAWLERVASAFHRIDPAATGDGPQLLIDHAFAGYNFDHLDGLHYRFDLREEALTDASGEEVRQGVGRVCDLTLADGTPLGPTDEVLVITNSYRAEGGGHFPAVAEAETVLSSSEIVRDAVAQHFATWAKASDAPLRPTWEFVPLGGCPLVVETGPGALAHPDRLVELGLRPGARAASGFQQFHWAL